jgi:hypothetical protein
MTPCSKFINKNMKKIFLILVLISTLVLISIGQDYPLSVGPAPVSSIKITPTDPLPLQVGTRYFAQISSSPTFQFGKSFMETCNITNIGAPFTITFPGGLFYKDGVVYTWNQSSPFQLWQVDTVTGVHTFVRNITGVPQANLTGMCWDGTTLFGVSTSLTVSQIFNATTGTPIGSPSAVCAGAILVMGRYGSQNGLFSVDIVADNWYKWNKTTGVATLVGPLGVNANFGQDGCVDPNDNTFYWMAYTTGPELRKLDTNGSSVVLCTYTAQATGIACVPRTSPYSAICRHGLNLVIPDLITMRDTIRMIGNNACSLIDVNVKLDTFIHTWDSDMAFSMTHNGTTTVALITNRGGSGDNFIGTVLDDSAATPISGGTAPFTGSFRPEQPLNTYNSQSPAGSWELIMLDNAGGDTGILKAWCITFQFTCPTGGLQTVEIPVKYILGQNYPNPFNPVTTIKYGLPKFGKTNLVVYDILGRVVTKLVDNDFKDAGTYEVKWDATNFSSGIYFYTLESGSYKETKKMLLIK